jgi:hypothetical protein
LVSFTSHFVSVKRSDRVTLGSQSLCDLVRSGLFLSQSATSG